LRPAAVALAFRIGEAEAVVRCLDWARVNGFALFAFAVARVVDAIVVVGGVGGVVGEVVKAVLRVSGDRRKLPAAMEIVN